MNIISATKSCTNQGENPSAKLAEAAPAEQATTENNKKAGAELTAKEKRARTLGENVEKKKARLDTKSARILRRRVESKRICQVVFMAVALWIFGVDVVQAMSARKVPLAPLPGHLCLAMSGMMPQHDCATSVDHDKIQQDCDEMEKDRDHICSSKTASVTSCKSLTKDYDFNCKNPNGRKRFVYQGAVEPAASLPAPASFAQIAEANDAGCTDTPTSNMVNNGKTCAEDVNYSNKCRHMDSWTTNKYCQQSCFDNGAGYDGDDCSIPAPTSAPTSTTTSTEAPTSAPTPYWSDPDNNCRDPSIASPPIYIDKYAGFKCSNGTSHADAGDKQACAEAAAAANHAFMSFNSMTSTCESTTACSVRTEADGWNAHKRWRGAYNATHADEVPACDGPSYSNLCATQVAVNGSRGESTCTSCEPGYAFAMSMGASRTGKCKRYKPATKVNCADPTSDGRFDPSAANGQICTKYVEAQLKLDVDDMQDEGARAHYASVMGGLWNQAIPKCRVRKETACDANGSCEVQKTVQCVKVCKLTGGGKGRPPWPVSDCSAALCDGDADGKYGELACKGAAMME